MMIRNILNRAKHGKRKASTEKNIALKQTRAISILYRDTYTDGTAVRVKTVQKRFAKGD